jgi:hypothetical protein
MRSKGHKSNKLFNMRGGWNWKTWLIICVFWFFCFFVTLIVFLVKRSNNDDDKPTIKPENELVYTTWIDRDNMLLNRIILFGALSALFFLLSICALMFLLVLGN